MSTMNAKVENKEMKVQVVLGTKVNAGEVQEFYTARCECGCRTIIASKESSLTNFLKNVKNAKCCGTEVKLVGLKKFKDGAMVTEKAKTKAPRIETTGLVAMGKKGVTNFQMIPAIEANIDDRDNLVKLFNTYPEVFISAAKYVPDKMKLVAHEIIVTRYPEHVANVGKKAAV